MARDFTSTSTQYLEFSAPASTWPITMACWYNPKNITAGMMLMYIGHKAGASRFLLFASGDVAGDPVAAAVANSANTIVIANSTSWYSQNTWSHACGVFESSSSTSVYLNGGSSATNTNSLGGSLTTINTGAVATQFFGGSSVTRASALIAEVGIWNVALTASEIASLAKGMTCDKVRPQGLVFYAPLVRDLQDVRGGRTITNNNTATVANHPRVYA
jgi:hypothetical protein